MDFIEIVHRQFKWQVSRQTGKYRHYDVYRDVLNAATSTIGKSKPNCVQKFAQNIYYSKRLMIHILPDNWLERWRTKLNIYMY